MLCAKILRDRLQDPVGSGVFAGPVTYSSAAKESVARLRWLFGSVNMFGSDIPAAEEMGKGLFVARKGEVKCEWRPRIWEVLETNGRPDGEVSLGLGMFGARRP